MIFESDIGNNLIQIKCFFTFLEKNKVKSEKLTEGRWQIEEIRSQTTDDRKKKIEVRNLVNIIL